MRKQLPTHCPKKTVFSDLCLTRASAKSASVLRHPLSEHQFFGLLIEKDMPEILKSFFHYEILILDSSINRTLDNSYAVNILCWEPTFETTVQLQH